MTPRVKPDQEKTEEKLPEGLTYNRVPKARVLAGPDKGTFTLTGSWNPNAEERTSVYHYVQELIQFRKQGYTPCDIALMVKDGPFPAILGSSLGFWAGLDEPRRPLIHGACWPLALAQSATSAAVTIARMRSEVDNRYRPPDCDCWFCNELRDDDK